MLAATLQEPGMLLLQAEIAQVKLDAQQARADGHLGRNQAAWEKERSARLESQLSEQDRTYKALTQQLNQNQVFELKRFHARIMHLFSLCDLPRFCKVNQILNRHALLKCTS